MESRDLDFDGRGGNGLSLVTSTSTGGSGGKVLKEIQMEARGEDDGKFAGAGIVLSLGGEFLASDDECLALKAAGIGQRGHVLLEGLQLLVFQFGGTLGFASVVGVKEYYRVRLFDSDGDDLGPDLAGDEGEEGHG